MEAERRLDVLRSHLRAPSDRETAIAAIDKSDVAGVRMGGITSVKDVIARINQWKQFTDETVPNRIKKALSEGFKVSLGVVDSSGSVLRRSAGRFYCRLCASVARLETSPILACINEAWSTCHMVAFRIVASCKIGVKEAHFRNRDVCAAVSGCFGWISFARPLSEPAMRESSHCPYRDG